MAHNNGDIVVTLFPFADGVSAKERPALICAGPWRVARNIEVCWVVMITTTVLKGWPSDIEVSDLSAAGLPVASIVRTLKIACIDVHNITRKIGVLDSRSLHAVRREVWKHLG